MQAGQAGLVQWWLTPCQLADALPFQVPQLAVDTLKLWSLWGTQYIFLYAITAQSFGTCAFWAD